MGTLKGLLEKPGFIAVFIGIVYALAFEMAGLGHLPPTTHEQAIYTLFAHFSESSFPPKIGLIRDFADLGHLGFYALGGRAFLFLKGDYYKLRILSFALTFFTFLLFVRLGYWFTYRNRLSPIYISLALLLLAINPQVWQMAFSLDHKSLFLIFALSGIFFFEKEEFGKAGILISLAVLVDWNGLWIAAAFLLSRIFGETSRLIRPERVLSHLLPFFISGLLFMTWRGAVPEGEATQWLEALREKTHLFYPAQFFYAIGLLSIYGLGFSWFWAIRARARALTIGAIWTALLIPLYFVLPLQGDLWMQVRYNLELPMGLLDYGAAFIAGPYKNLVLFLPWLAGMFFFVQLLMMDILDRSKWMRFYIVLFFLGQATVFGFDNGGTDMWGGIDGELLLVLPIVLLFTLGEGLIGEQGKLS